MWGEIVGWFKYLFTLARDAQRDREEREKMRQQFDDLTKAVEKLYDRDEQRTREETHEREKLLLRLKIQLLEFERRLQLPPPGTPTPSLDEE